MTYSQTLIDHFRNPRNAGALLDPDGVGEAENPVCGDLAKIAIRVRDGRVGEARFQAYGCGASIAAASVGTELVRGKTLEDTLSLGPEAIEAALDGLPPERKHAAAVVAAALHAAVEDHLARVGGVHPRGGGRGARYV